MILAQYSNVSFSFPDKPIIRDFSFQIKDGRRIGLIGDNGIGKTTLLKLLKNELSPDTGSIMVSKDVQIGSLEQIPDHAPSVAIRTILETPFHHLIKMEQDIESLETLISESNDSAALKRYDTLMEQFDRQGGYTFRAKTREVMAGLGFSTPEWERPLNRFSGGEQSRILLAKLLLLEPSLMLLDEPTNHLDIQAIEWLENYLQTYKGGVMVVSHDRYFLDRVVTEILELAFQKITHYHGNYSKYLVDKEVQQQLLLAKYEHQQEEIARTEDFIRRNMAAQKTKQAQSRVKMLAKMERIERPSGDTKSMKLRIETPHAGGRIVLTTSELSKRFDQRVLFANADLQLERGQIIGVMGPNGCGKTTFLKILSGSLPADSGKVEFGYKIKHIMFDQKLDDLDPRFTIMEEILKIKPWMTQFEARSYLGIFLFSGESVLRTVGQLSGGEKARLALAKLLLQKANLLFLDEPTNHLDLKARDSLEDALLGFQGSIIMVTHDRYLIDRVVDKLWVFDNASIIEFAGNYSEYKTRQNAGARTGDQEKDGRSSGDARKIARKIRVDIRLKTGKSARYYEHEIERVEEQLKIVHEDMKNPALATDWIALDDLVAKESDLKTKLTELIQFWEYALEMESGRAEQEV